MQPTPYRAFGYVILRTKLTANEIITDEMMKRNRFSIDDPSPDVTGSISGSSGGYIWVLLDGIHTYTNEATGDVDTHERGWCNLVNPLTAGDYEFQSVTDSEYICVSPIVNADRTPVVPDLEYFALGAGQSTSLAKGTKLYLLDGELSVNGKKIFAMRQVHFVSGSATVSADEQCYGLIFKGD